MKVKAEINETDLKMLVIQSIREKFNILLATADLKFEVKSKQNYREQEWEIGSFRIVFEVDK